MGEWVRGRILRGADILLAHLYRGALRLQTMGGGSVLDRIGGEGVRGQNKSVEIGTGGNGQSVLGILLEVMVHDNEENEEISCEEEAAVARSKERFQHNDGIPFEQVVAELGFTLDEIRAAASSDRDTDPAV